jgi:hypothetical protein
MASPRPRTMDLSSINLSWRLVQRQTWVTVQNTLDSGMVPSEKESAPRFLLTELFTKAPFIRTLNVERVFSPGLTRNLTMMESGDITSFKVMVNLSGTMKKCILVNFIMINLTERVSCNGQMVENMMVNGRWIICMGLEVSLGLMVDHMKVDGATTNLTVPQNSLPLQEKSKWDFGKTVKK